MGDLKNMMILEEKSDYLMNDQVRFFKKSVNKSRRANDDDDDYDSYETF